MQQPPSSPRKTTITATATATATTNANANANATAPPEPRAAQDGASAPGFAQAYSPPRATTERARPQLQLPHAGCAPPPCLSPGGGGGASCGSGSAASSWGELHHPARRTPLPCAAEMGGGGGAAAAVGSAPRLASPSISISHPEMRDEMQRDEMQRDQASMQSELRALDAVLAQQARAMHTCPCMQVHGTHTHMHTTSRHMDMGAP